MPDLGKYATDVLSAYAIALILLIGLVTLSLRQSRQARRALDEIEKRMRK
jgi:heme exporter protein D